MSNQVANVVAAALSRPVPTLAVPKPVISSHKPDKAQGKPVAAARLYSALSPLGLNTFKSAIDTVGVSRGLASMRAFARMHEQIARCGRWAWARARMLVGMVGGRGGAGAGAR